MWIKENLHKKKKSNRTAQPQLEGIDRPSAAAVDAAWLDRAGRISA